MVIGSFHEKFVQFFNTPNGEFQTRAPYQLSSNLSTVGISCHVKLHPPFSSEKAWSEHTPNDPQLVGGRGCVLFIVTHGTLLLNVYRNSLAKMDLLVANQSKLEAVLSFTKKYLDPTLEGFRQRQVQSVCMQYILTLL